MQDNRIFLIGFFNTSLTRFEFLTVFDQKIRYSVPKEYQGQEEADKALDAAVKRWPDTKFTIFVKYAEAIYTRPEPPPRTVRVTLFPKGGEE